MITLLNTCACMHTPLACYRPEPKVPERMKCSTFVRAEVMGTKMASRNVSCTGEYCFKAKISRCACEYTSFWALDYFSFVYSKLGHMAKYNTIGCASFIDDSELAEELNPTG